LGTEVTKDYSDFLASGREYKEAAEQIQNFMVEAEREAEELEKGITVITEAIGGMTIPPSTNPQRVYLILHGKTTDVVNYTENLYEMTKECRELSKQLNEITSGIQDGNRINGCG